MRAACETKTLDQISTNLDSRRVPITKTARSSGEYPYYGASGIVDYVADYIFDEDTLLISEDGANLLARSTPIAFPASGKYWVNNHAHILKFENPTTQRFVELYLESIPLDGYITGAAQPKLNQKALNSIPIPVPPLGEQQRIVGILDVVFEGIAAAKTNAEKNIQNARGLFGGHLQSIFSQRGKDWVSFPFSDCIEDVKYTTKIQRNEFLQEGKYPVISQEAEFTNGYWDNAADVFKVTEPVVIFGDHTKIFKYVDFDFVLGADGVKILQPKKFLLPRFFFYYLRSAPLKSLGYSRHYRLLKELEVSYPNAEEQTEIAKELDALEAETERLVSIYEQKLAGLEELEKSFLHEAFASRL
jgi:type I restriction enzyme S subunit